MNSILEMYMQLGLLGTIGVVFIWMLIKQNNQNTMSLEQFRQQGELLRNIYEALKPMTYMQAEDLFSLIIGYSEEETLNILRDVIRKNNIHEPGHESIIRENINGELKAMYTHHVTTLHRQQYSGKQLDEYMYNWTMEVTKVMYDEIYNQGKPDEERFKKNIGAVYYRIKNNIESELSRA